MLDLLILLDNEVLYANAYTPRNVRYRITERGFAWLEAALTIPIATIWRWFDASSPPRVLLKSQGTTLWDGYLTDPELVIGDEEQCIIRAVGGWDALGDAPYTALWSDASTERWRPLLETEHPTANASTPQRYTMDNNNRLYISPNNNAVLGNTGGPKAALWAYRAPHRGLRNLTRISFDYNVVVPDTTWEMQAADASNAPYDVPWSFIGVYSISAGSGSGTVVQSLAPSAVGVCVYILRNAPDATYTGQTGAHFLRCTNVRVTTATPPITAAMIAQHIASYASTHLSPRIASSTARINAGLPYHDLLNALWEDADMRNVLREITAMGDASGVRLACGVWEDGMIVLDRLSNLEREWLVDVGEWRLSRSLKRIASQAYATYRSPGGQRLRTTTAVREDVAQRFGYRSIAQIDAPTTSETTANALRSAELSRRVEAQAMARFTVRSVYQPLGERVPLWRVRPYDVLTIRNLPSISGLLRDPIRRVRVLAVEYDADRDRLTVEVEDPITLSAVIA